MDLTLVQDKRFLDSYFPLTFVQFKNGFIKIQTSTRRISSNSFRSTKWTKEISHEVQQELFIVELDISENFLGCIGTSLWMNFPVFRTMQTNLNLLWMEYEQNKSNLLFSQNSSVLVLSHTLWLVHHRTGQKQHIKGNVELQPHQTGLYVD